jgi:hypothetical protein
MKYDITPSEIFQLHRGILKEGGLAILETGTDSSLFEESVDEVFRIHNISSKQELLTFTFMLNTFGKHTLVEPLLVKGYKLGLLTKDDLTALYLSQSKEARTTKPFITLQNLWDIPFKAIHEMAKSECTSPSLVFTKEELLLLANRVVSVHISDLNLIFKNWFYRIDGPLPLERRFLLYWFKLTMDQSYEPEGKVASLIAIALFNTYPEEIDQGAIINKIHTLAYTDPSSHGIYRYCSLSFAIAGNDVQMRRKAIDSYVNFIITILERQTLEFGIDFAIDMFLEEPEIPKEEKRIALTKIHNLCRQKIKDYNHLIVKTQDVLNNHPS